VLCCAVLCNDTGTSKAFTFFGSASLTSSAAGAVAITGLLTSVAQALTSVLGGLAVFDRHRCSTIAAATLSSAALASVCAWDGG
jgi:hypothetical protein